MSSPAPPAAPPGSSPALRKLAGGVLGPVERFLHLEAASGLLLLAAAAIALLWSSSPFSESYAALWHAPVTLGIGSWVAKVSLHFVVNDILMVLFFFVVGLEIRREIHAGQLSTLKRAALPFAAAAGGMLAPALIYAALNGPETLHGWGIPTATDIAFAVGILALLGKRIAPALRILLLSLATIDDIGAIVVIALFYSSGIVVWSLGVGLLGVLGIIVMQRFGVRSPWAYVFPGLVIWAGILGAGVHPTIAGVVAGLLTPSRAWFGPDVFLTATREHLDALESDMRREGCVPGVMGQHLAAIGQAQREALSPVDRLVSALHPWVAYGIMPLFALANAGVDLRTLSLDGAAPVFYGVTLGLVVGKPVGVLLASWICVKLGIAQLPRGTGWKGVTVVGLVAGIGFTMSLFVTGLAFPGQDTYVNVARLGILVASGTAGAIALLVGFIVLPKQVSADAAQSESEAEASDDA